LPLTKLTDTAAADTSRVFVEDELTHGGTEVSRNMTNLVPVKQIQFKPASLKVETSQDKGN
jgi:hypothetical protein